jgi:hypothetical protein
VNTLLVVNLNTPGLRRWRCDAGGGEGSPEGRLAGGAGDQIWMIWVSLFWETSK